MTGLWILLAVAGALALLALLMGLARALLRRDLRLADTAIIDLHDLSTVDKRTGAVRSVQAAELRLSERALGELWSPAHLERLARTYWRYLTRVTLGLVRVRYTERERFVVLLFRPLTLLAFRAPEYELERDHGVVRWRIERGLLVARAGRESKGHLQIDVRRLQGEDSEGARLRIEVEVAGFHPAIASGISRRLYNATQSHIHVIVTHGFLRSLARLDLADRTESGQHVGRLAEDGEAQGTAPPSSRSARPRTAPAASRDRGAR